MLGKCNMNNLVLENEKVSNDASQGKKGAVNRQLTIPAAMP